MGLANLVPGISGGTMLLAAGVYPTFINAIAEKAGLTQGQTKKVVQSTLDAIVEAVGSQGRIELRDFGVFEVRERAGRRARNPRTGEKLYVPAKRVVVFKPGRLLEERVK